MTSTPSASSARASALSRSGERHRHLDAVAVMGVGDGVDDGHRPRQRELELALGMGARELRLARMHASLEAQRAGDRRHHRLVAVGADADLDLAREVDAVDEFEKAVHEMLARLLAVGDDVDAAILLQLEREQGGVALGVVELARRRAATAPTACSARRARRASAGFRRWWSKTVAWWPRSYRLRPASSHRANRSGRAAAGRPGRRARARAGAPPAPPR